MHIQNVFVSIHLKLIVLFSVYEIFVYNVQLATVKVTVLLVFHVTMMDNVRVPTTLMAKLVICAKKVSTIFQLAKSVTVIQPE